MAQEDKRDDALTDETTQLKKRARRRLIGAAALALLAAVVLPLVMDHQPAPPLKDIQVRIPSPDDGMPAPAKPASSQKPAEAPAVAEPSAPVLREEVKPEVRQEPKAKPEAKPAPKAESRPEPKAAEKVAAAGVWEVQLGAYQDPTRVRNLVAKLKDLGLTSYTEKVDTPNGTRTRVRAGPFPNQEAAEKARGRIKAIGVDGPVAQKS